MGSTNAAVAQCQMAVAVANDAYTNSQIGARMRLVHCMEVNYSEPGTQENWTQLADQSDRGRRDPHSS